MPVVARLSKRFYDELGEDIANELVELLNQVDGSSRRELRELNELNFARFDAKLEQRVADSTARIDKLATELGGRIGGVETRMEARFAAIEKVMVTKSDLAEALADRFTAQNRFLYLAMAMQFAATLGLWLR